MLWLEAKIQRLGVLGSWGPEAALEIKACRKLRGWNHHQEEVGEDKKEEEEKENKVEEEDV